MIRKEAPRAGLVKAALAGRITNAQVLARTPWPAPLSPMGPESPALVRRDLEARAI